MTSPLYTAVLSWSLVASATPPEVAPAEPAAVAPEEKQPSVISEGERSSEAPEPVPSDAESARGPTVIDAVLPSGVRVIAAQDDTLPVAAVVLALETGTEDDPPGFPGLIHAMAYHLLQGNRDIAPGGIASLVHGAGGLTSLAIGPAQIRYESLVPISILGETLWAEAHRLRAPTVSDELWRESLGWARRDKPRKWSLPLTGLAAVHNEPGLAHDGRKVSPALAEMSARAVAAQIADRMSYERATLVVVAPLPPAVTLARVQPLFADLPASTRRPPSADPPAPLGDAPRTVAVPGQDGTRVAWPLAPGPAATARARVLCATLQRQRRAPDEPPRARIRCSVDADPRRGTLTLRVTGTDDPIGLLRARLHRIEAGTEARLIERYKQETTEALELALRRPLELARSLAQVPMPTPGDVTAVRPLDALTGVSALRDPQAQWTLPLGGGVRLVAPPPKTQETPLDGQGGGS